jgi:hypothetical protein
VLVLLKWILVDIFPGMRVTYGILGHVARDGIKDAGAVQMPMTSAGPRQDPAKTIAI